MAQPSQSPTVFVVDDDPEVCEAIAMILRSARLRTRTFTDPRQFLQVVEPGTRGCVVLDVRMPHLSGLELQQRLAKLGSRLPVLFVTGHGDIPMALRAVRAGAIDFIEKPFRAEALLKAVSTALSFDSRQQHEEDAPDAEQARRMVASLSPRLVQTALLVAEGLSSREIAERLGLSPRTVEMHRARLLKALGVGTTAEMIRIVMLASHLPASAPPPPPARRGRPRPKAPAREARASRAARRA